MSQQIDFSVPISIAGPVNNAGTFFPAPSSALLTSDMPAMIGDINAMVSNSGAGNPPVANHADEHMALIFKDNFGANYSLPAVGHVFSSTPTDFQTSLETSLKSLPNKMVGDVSTTVLTASNRGNAFTCPGSGACAPVTSSIQVTYEADIENGNLIGTQNLLQCPSAYGCSQEGCRPHIKMPFAVRYVGHEAAVDYTAAVATNAGVTDSTGSTVNVEARNYNADAFAAHNAKKIVLMAEGSDPRLPLGKVLNNQKDGAERFDARIEILVVDPMDNADDLIDLMFYKVGFYDGAVDEADGLLVDGGGNPVSSYEFQEFRFKPTAIVPTDQKLFPTPTTATSFKYDGYQAFGRLPAVGFDSLSLRDFPGVNLNFKSANMVADGEQRVFEIAYKLPTCKVSVFEGAGLSKEYKVGTFVENTECSGRGNCDYTSGECKCFQGYYGLSCSQRTTLI